MSESLRKLIEPHFLRRTKAMVLGKKEKATDGVDGSRDSPENSVRYKLHLHYKIIAVLTQGIPSTKTAQPQTNLTSKKF